MSGAEDLMVLARVAGSVVVVLVLVVLAARMARRAGVRGPGAGLRVVDRAGLSRDASVAVVEVAGKALVVGVTAHGVSVLSELDPQALRAAAPAPRGAAPGAVRVARTTDAGDGGVPRPRPANGPVLSPATWRQGMDALRDLTARRNNLPRDRG